MTNGERFAAATALTDSGNIADLPALGLPRIRH